MGSYIGNHSIVNIHKGDMAVSSVYLGTARIFPNGGIVTYIQDSKTSTEFVEPGGDCLTPSSFSPTKDGYEFLGWSDNLESTDTLTEKTMENDPIILYAVWKAPDKELLTSRLFQFRGQDWAGVTSGRIPSLSTYASIYSIDPNLYDGHTVTGHVNGPWELYNNTIGLAWSIINISGISIRRTNKWGSGGKPEDPGGYVGSYGATFTLSNRPGDFTVSFSGAWPKDWINFDINKLIGIGKKNRWIKGK